MILIISSLHSCANRRYFQRAMSGNAQAALAAPTPQHLLIQRIGKRALSSLRFAGGFGQLSAQTIRELFQRPFYFRLVLEQLHSIGVQSIMLVLITGLATGSVMALQ